MILIYTHQVSHRVKYTFDLVFKSILGVDYTITTDRDSFKQFQGEKISYTHAAIADELFFVCTNLLFETGVEIKTLNIHFPKKPNELPQDVFACSFLMASRYEEYLPFTGDNYGRFSAVDSLAYKNNLLQYPIVNSWAKKIRELISSRYSAFTFPQKKYSYTPTIDIDNAYAYSGKNLARTAGGYIRAIIKSDRDDFLKRKNVTLRKEKDPYDTYDFQTTLHTKYNLKPIYFFLLGDWAVNDKNLPYTHPLMQSLIKGISKNTETGIHPSFASNRDPTKIEIEKKRLEKINNLTITKSRQHFLMLRFPDTYRNLISAGITDDYTMGFADRIGFRAGICTPYKFYDLEKEKETNLTIHPFAIMDGTLNSYMKLTPNQAIEEVKNIIKEIKNVDGELITIWHNETLSNWREWKGWEKVYERVIHEAQ